MQRGALPEQVEGGKHRAIRAGAQGRLGKPGHDRNIGNPVEQIGKPGRNRGSEKCRCVTEKPEQPVIIPHPKTLLLLYFSPTYRDSYVFQQRAMRRVETPGNAARCSGKTFQGTETSAILWSIISYRETRSKPGQRKMQVR